MFNRNISSLVSRWLYKDEIIILNGARQVGKTSLLKLLEEQLKKDGINERQIIYFTLEDIDILNELNSSPKKLLNYLKNPLEKTYFFIDEIQYLDNPSNFLKYLFDEHRDRIKLIVTGSSSLELKAGLQDSLVGRKVSFEVNPLNFYEFLIFKKSPLIEYYGKNNIPANAVSDFANLLNEYLIFGGMPKIVLTDDYEDKKTLLNNYVSDYINKDVRYLGKIDSILKFNNLLRLLSGSIGSLLNINEITNTLNIKRKDIEFYLNILENTYILNKINPFHKNIRSQITKMPKYYFFDIGIRNQILGNFTGMNSRTDNGAMFENFIFLELKSLIDKQNIFFYRTVHKAEIDFIVEKNGRIIPIEVKYKNYKQPLSSRVLSNFMNIEGINCSKSYIINLNLNESTENISYLPFYNIAVLI